LKGLIPQEVVVGFVFSPDLHIPGKVDIIGQWNYSSMYYNNVANALPIAQTPELNLFNASIAWSSPNTHWRVAFEGTNIFDHRYIQEALQIGNAFSPSVTAYPGKPRLFDLRVTARF
jgi:outer membrane receptor protein involved in Fe transport